jgi:hypothetical protein
MTLTDIFALLLVGAALLLAPERYPLSKCAEQRITKPRVVKTMHGALAYDGQKLCGKVALADDRCVWEQWTCGH